MYGGGGSTTRRGLRIGRRDIEESAEEEHPRRDRDDEPNGSDECEQPESGRPTSFSSRAVA